VIIETLRNPVKRNTFYYGPAPARRSDEAPDTILRRRHPETKSAFFPWTRSASFFAVSKDGNNPRRSGEWNVIVRQEATGTNKAAEASTAFVIKQPFFF
jgi:hypothetical protein